jgi:predicted membrane metal-binding protein
MTEQRALFLYIMRPKRRELCFFAAFFSIFRAFLFCAGFCAAFFQKVPLVPDYFLGVPDFGGLSDLLSRKLSKNNPALFRKMRHKVPDSMTRALYYVNTKCRF